MQPEGSYLLRLNLSSHSMDIMLEACQSYLRAPIFLTSELFDIHLMIVHPPFLDTLVMYLAGIVLFIIIQLYIMVYGNPFLPGSVSGNKPVFKG